jgi:hypothetical protein
MSLYGRTQVETLQNEFCGAPQAARVILFLVCHVIENHVTVDFGEGGRAGWRKGMEWDWEGCGCRNDGTMTRLSSSPSIRFGHGAGVGMAMAVWALVPVLVLE